MPSAHQTASATSSPAPAQARGDAAERRPVRAAHRATATSARRTRPTSTNTARPGVVAPPAKAANAMSPNRPSRSAAPPRAATGAAGGGTGAAAGGGGTSRSARVVDKAEDDLAST